MSGKKRIADTYAYKANFLRSIGYNIAYKGNKKSTQTQYTKAAISRIWNDKGIYANERTKFVATSKSNRKELRGAVSNNQITPRGVILVIPSGADKKSFKYSIKREKGLGVYIEQSYGGDQVDRIISLNPERLSLNPIKETRDAIAKVIPAFSKLSLNGLRRDPVKAIKKLSKREQKILPREVKITVNGYETPKTGYTVFSFFHYNENLFDQATNPDYYNEDLDDDLDDEDYNERQQIRKMRKSPMTPEEYTDVFNVKLIYQKPKTKTKSNL